MVSFELQRKNMVESQVRPSDVTDRRLIRAMLEIPRESFVPAAVQPVAYMDQDVAVTPAATSPRRYLVAPRLFAKLGQAMELGDRDAVLEVGTATGYGAAVLSRVARNVVALECDAGLAQQARDTLAAFKIDNAKVVTGPLSAGYAAEGPYDAIVVAGAWPEIPAGLLDQLKDGGRLVAVVADAAGARLVQWRRLGAAFDSRTVMEVGAPSLPGMERTPTFVF